MKRVFVVHGWAGNPNDGWKPWLKKELEANGFNVTIPAMPSPAKPRMKEWIETLKNLVGKPDEETILVGHSLGCIAILRYLEELKEGKIHKAVLIAGFSNNLGFDEIKNFFEKPIDWNKIKQRCDNFVLLHSDNDPYVPLKEGKILEKELNSKLVIEKGKKHFSNDDGIDFLLQGKPILKAVLEE